MPVTRSRAVAMAGLVLMLTAAVLAVTGPAEASRRPAPSSLRATAGQATLTVRWHWVRRAPGYRVRWSVHRSMAGSHRLASVPHRAVIRGLSPSTRYFVQVAVAARKGHGRRLSPWSKVVSRRTPPPPCPTVGSLGDPTPAAPTGLDTDLRVASFNIRAMTLDSALYPQQRWASRADRVAAFLLGAATTRNAATAAPDVIALQEASQSYGKFPDRCTNQMTDLRNRLDAGSGRHYEATSLDPAASSGTRILFDTTRLRLERAGSVLLAAASAPHPHLAWAVFQERDGGQRFFFGSVHLVPPSSPETTIVRDAEWDRLLAVLADPTVTGGLPIVIAGDFNSRRSGAGANTSALTHLPRMWAAGVGDTLTGDNDSTDPNLLVSAARAQRTTNAQCESFNAFRVDQRCDDRTDPADDTIGSDIDYVFASNDLVVKTWELVLDLDPLHNWLGTIPSDHNLVRATITLPGVS